MYMIIANVFDIVHRQFIYLTEEPFSNIINQINFKIDKLWINEGKLNRNVKWLNVVLEKGFRF